MQPNPGISKLSRAEIERSQETERPTILYERTLLQKKKRERTCNDFAAPTNFTN